MLRSSASRTSTASASLLLSMTMIYTHVMQQGVAGVQSPLDLLSDLSGDEVRAAVAATRRLDGAAARATAAVVPCVTPG